MHKDIIMLGESKAQIIGPNFHEMLEALIEKRKKLDELKKDPEIAEALKLSEEYHGLIQELQKLNGNTQYVPMPYPAQPTGLFPSPYKITIGDSTSKDYTTNARSL